MDGAPACPFVAFDDERDERAPGPDHRHRCYAETEPAPRALAHQEAYCLSSGFPVCPTFQDWARREAARSRVDVAKAAAARDDTDGTPQRNPPRNWSAPPPWLSRKARGDGAPDPIWADGTGGGDAEDGDDGDDRDDGDDSERSEDEVRAEVPRRGRGLSGSYADRVASDPSADLPGDLPDEVPGTPPADAESRPRGPFAARPEPSSPSYRAPGWDDDAGEADDHVPRRFRRRERDAAGPVGAGAAAPEGGPSHEWERARPLEAYPTLRSRRLPELSVPPILIAVVAIALAMAVVFALPGLLGFGNPLGGSSASPTVPIRTLLPSLAPTPIPKPTATIYIVQPGDTMSRIAGRFGIPLEDLIAANTETVPDPNKVRIGQELIIPVPLPTELPAASEIPAASPPADG